MIQRIQTIWLLLAFLLSAVLFVIPVFKAGDNALKIGGDYIAVIINALTLFLSLWAVFRYKNRKSQKQMTFFNVVVNIGLLAWIFKSVNDFEEVQKMTFGQDGYFWIGAFLPIFTILCLIMAIAGIRKDEKLLKSLDRLR